MSQWLVKHSTDRKLGDCNHIRLQILRSKLKTKLQTRKQYIKHNILEYYEIIIKR